MNIESINGDYQFQEDELVEQQPPSDSIKDPIQQHNLDKMRGFINQSKDRGLFTPFKHKAGIQGNQDTLQSTPLNKSFQNQLSMNVSMNNGPGRFTGVDATLGATQMRFMNATMNGDGG